MAVSNDGARMPTTTDTSPSTRRQLKPAPPRQRQPGERRKDRTMDFAHASGAEPRVHGVRRRHQSPPAQTI
jgi:hypothetical protein